MATAPTNPAKGLARARELLLTPSICASLASGETVPEVIAIDASLPRETLYPNPAWIGGKPVLTVLIPFYRHDPSPLLFVLAREQVPAEVILLDNGSCDPALLAKVQASVAAMDLPATILKLDRHEGVSKGRNRLARHARSSSLLFVDSDMLPDGCRFLATYIRLIEAQNPAVVFGGYSMRQAPNSPEYALHRALAARSDCAPAAIRRLFAEKHVFTSNLLVRRDVLAEEQFDEGFRGWGWEDIEWSMRVGRRYPLTHIDNPATHLGLSTPRMLAAKFEQSAANFSRMVCAHQDRVGQYRSYRAARLLKRVPMRKVWKPLLKSAALMESAPIPARAMAMRLYRAVLYADSV